MEQITRKEDGIYYGNKLCRDADEAYELFRNDYHEWLGKRAYRRLNRVGSRKERVHGFGFCFDGGIERPAFYHDVHRRVDTRLLGLVCGSYCRKLGGWDIPDCVGDVEYDEWIDWALSDRSGAIRLVGKTKVGRTSEIAKKKF